MDARILHDKLLKILNQSNFLRYQGKNRNQSRCIIFYHKINCNSNEGKERRKGVYVLTIRKIDDFLQYVKLIVFYSLRIIINETTTNSANSAPTNLIYLPFFITILTIYNLFTIVFFYHGQSDIFEVIDINKLTMHKNANFLITTTF